MMTMSGCLNPQKLGCHLIAVLLLIITLIPPNEPADRFCGLQGLGLPRCVLGFGSVQGMERVTKQGLSKCLATLVARS